MMYKCNDCGHLFEDGEEAVWTENRGEFWGFPSYETIIGCPICKGSYSEIEPCRICGGYNHNAGDCYCNDCKKDVKTRFENFVNKEFTEEERELLNELYEGEWI